MMRAMVKTGMRMAGRSAATNDAETATRMFHRSYDPPSTTHGLILSLVPLDQEQTLHMQSTAMNEKSEEKTDQKMTSKLINLGYRLTHQNSLLRWGSRAVDQGNKRRERSGWSLAALYLL